MKINLAELKKALDRIEKDRGGTTLGISIPLDRHVEIKYSTDAQEAVITIYPEESAKFPEIMKKERL